MARYRFCSFYCAADTRNECNYHSGGRLRGAAGGDDRIGPGRESYEVETQTG